CAEVHVAEPDDEVGRRGDDVEHVVPLGQPVDTPDELDVVRAPRRVPAHGGLVPGHRLVRRGIVERDRQGYLTGRKLHSGQCRKVLPGLGYPVRHGAHRHAGPVDGEQERTYALDGLDDAVRCADGLCEQVHLEAYGEVELGRTDLDEQVVVT